MNTFAEFFHERHFTYPNSLPLEARHDVLCRADYRADTDTQFLSLVAENGLHVWRPYDENDGWKTPLSVDQGWCRLLVGVVTWSAYDMAFLDKVCQAMSDWDARPHRPHARRPHVDVFLIDRYFPGEARLCCPGIGQVLLTPVLGVWRYGKPPSGYATGVFEASHVLRVAFDTDEPYRTDGTAVIGSICGEEPIPVDVQTSSQQEGEAVKDDLAESNQMRIKCVVACRNAGGEPDFYPVVVCCSPEQYDSGDHYDEAEVAAVATSYETYRAIVYDENDGPEWLFAAFDWNQAEVVDAGA